MSNADQQRAAALLADGDITAALDIYGDIIDRGAADEYTYGQAAEALTALGEYARAIAFFERALERAPERPELHNNVARALNSIGEAHRAAAHLEKAAGQMRDLEALCNLACIAPGVPGYDLRRVYELRCAFGNALAYRKAPASKALARAGSLPPGPRARPPRPARPLKRPLHVAYLSAHFARPAYMGPVWALINHHDRRRFRVTLLSDAEIEPPLPGYCDADEDTVASIAGTSNAQLAAIIAELGIDLLVDLSAYSYPPRLSLFARRAAPVVATWFNMYATSGLPGIDYIIGDAQTVFPGEEVHYSETVLRLPQSYLSFQPFEGRPPPGPGSLAQAGSPFTFGSLVSLYKITRPVRDAWAEILRRAPEARLVLANADLKSAENRAWLLREFEERGIDGSRIEIRDPAPHAQFLRYYDSIDLALDAFPYSGGTTTMEALWQGVPVLTQSSDGWAARTTASILHDTPLRDFCCADVPQYVARAVEFATVEEQRARCARLRPELRDLVLRSGACNGAALAGHMEQLYEGMFRGG